MATEATPEQRAELRKRAEEAGAKVLLALLDERDALAVHVAGIAVTCRHLEARIAELEAREPAPTCCDNCGREMSPGLCAVCDNDE